MEPIGRRNALKTIAGMGALAACSQAPLGAAEPQQTGPDGRKRLKLEIPQSLKAEHDELHKELVHATQVGGKTGEAAKAVAKVLHPHFVKEEELAMPPLGLLQALVDGPVRPETAQVVELTDQLKRELPTMIQEHKELVGTLRTLAQAAEEENQPRAATFAKHLEEHAETEEVVLYPAAILVGEFIKLKLTH